MPHTAGLAAILARNKNRKKDKEKDDADNDSNGREQSPSPRKNPATNAAMPAEPTMPPVAEPAEPQTDVKERLTSVITRIDALTADNPELADISTELSGILSDLPGGAKMPGEPEAGMNESDRFFSEITEPYEERAGRRRGGM